MSDDDFLTSCQWSHEVDDDFLVKIKSNKRSFPTIFNHEKKKTDETEDLEGVEIRCAGTIGETGCDTGIADSPEYASR